jgi:hypothetical protein
MLLVAGFLKFMTAGWYPMACFLKCILAYLKRL